MDGFLWLLLQMTVVLAAAAVLFLILGWRWRARIASVHSAALTATADAESVAAERARHEKEAAHLALAKQTVAANREAAQLIESREHQRHLEREILRLAEELKSARRAAEEAEMRLKESGAEEEPPLAGTPFSVASTGEAPPAPASEGIPANPESTRAVDHPATAGKSEVEPAGASNDSERPNKPESKIAPSPQKSASEVLSALQAKIATQQVLVGALNQEREGWRQRTEALRDKAAVDPAGFALTSKNHARSETQYSQAVGALKSLQKQSDALERTLNAAVSEDDDLTLIKGIKTALDQQLRAFGIRSYRQIALMSPDDLQAFSELLAFKNRAKRDQWQKQARELHRGKYGGDPAR